METGADEVCEFGEITIESCKGRDWMEIAPSASPVMTVRLLSLYVFAHGGLHRPVRTRVFKICTIHNWNADSAIFIQSFFWDKYMIDKRLLCKKEYEKCLN